MKPLTLLLVIMKSLAWAQTTELEASLLQAITNKHYEAPTQARLSRARELFRRTLRAEDSAAGLAANWGALGFDFREVERKGETLWLVCESGPNHRGGGWYLFRMKQQLELALEAPHARNDINSGLVAFRLFCAGKARALAAATITRHRADMGHLEPTFFQAFTLAFADVCPGGMVVQVHGFDAASHTGASADIVASAGTRWPRPWFGQLVQDLRNTTSLLVLAYPRDTRVLGATQNVQGRALQKAGFCRFLHLEMTAQLRDRLTHDAELCRALIEVLGRNPQKEASDGVRALPSKAGQKAGSTP